MTTFLILVACVTAAALVWYFLFREDETVTTFSSTTTTTNTSYLSGRKRGQRVRAKLSNGRTTIVYRTQNSRGGWNYYDADGYFLDDFMLGLYLLEVLDDNAMWYAMGEFEGGADDMIYLDESGDLVESDGTAFASHAETQEFIDSTPHQLSDDPGDVFDNYSPPPAVDDTPSFAASESYESSSPSYDSGPSYSSSDYSSSGGYDSGGGGFDGGGSFD